MDSYYLLYLCREKNVFDELCINVRSVWLETRNSAIQRRNFFFYEQSLELHDIEIPINQTPEKIFCEKQDTVFCSKNLYKLFILVKTKKQ